MVAFDPPRSPAPPRVPGRKLKLTLACGDYDRTRDPADGTVRPNGIELTRLRLPLV